MRKDKELQYFLMAVINVTLSFFLQPREEGENISCKVNKRFLDEDL